MQRVTLNRLPAQPLWLFPRQRGKGGMGAMPAATTPPSQPSPTTAGEQPQGLRREPDSLAFTGIAAEKLSIRRLSKYHSTLPPFHFFLTSTRSHSGSLVPNIQGPKRMTLGSAIIHVSSANLPDFLLHCCVSFAGVTQGLPIQKCAARNNVINRCERIGVMV